MNNSEKQAAKERLSTAKKQKNTLVAIAQIKEILEDCPQFIPAWLELGLRYRKTGDRQSALATFETALQLHPQHPNLRAQLSTEQLHFNQVEDCYANLQQLLAIAPQHVRGIINLGKVYQKKNDKDRAKELFKKALQIKPEADEATVNLVEQLQKSQKFTEAIQYLDEAFRHAPNNFNLLICRGELERNRLDFDLALEYFQQAIARYPEKIRAYFHQIDTLADLQRLDEAEKELEILRDRYRDDFSILIYSGDFNRKLGQRQKALEWYHLAQTKATRSGQEIKARTLIAEELKALGRFDEALECIELAIERCPDNLGSLMVKGGIYQAQIDLTEAIEVYQHILSLKSTHFEARKELAVAYSQSGRVDRAIALLEETYLLLGSKIEILIRLGKFHQALENWEIAEAWYEKACQEHPDRCEGYCELANLYFLQGDIEAAFELLKIAQSKKPDSVQVTLRLIEFHKHLGDLDSCDLLLQNALERRPLNTQLLWHLCRVNINRGNYTAALDALARINVDHRYGISSTQKLKADIYLHQYDYEKAEECLKTAISSSSIAVGERERLAIVLTATGRIDEARQELKTATKELALKTPLSKFAVPLKSNIAAIANQLRINPPLLAELQEAQQATGYDRILALARLSQREPNYLGAALYLNRELRTQGIFEKFKQALSQASAIPAIPKRIVQFWDEPEPPPEVQKICQSWRDRNPEYEYHRFSLDTAMVFLAEHYGDRVLQAFANCEHPATQSDFFRLAYLNIMGGFYADADDLCRQSLNSLVEQNSELIVYQEEQGAIGNNFLGCVPGQSMIRKAFEQAVENLSYYCNESPWFKTGPGLITSVVGSSLAAYLPCEDYQMYPRLLVLTQSEVRQFITQHISLPYKKTDKSWLHKATTGRISSVSLLPSTK